MRALHLPALSPTAAASPSPRSTRCGSRARRAAAPRKVLQVPHTRYVLGPTWTPDGTALVYADDRDGLFAVRRRDLASGEETVLAGGGRVFPALSPDGTRLACLDMSGNLVVRDLPDGAERVLAAPLGAGGLPGRPSWSPDGRYVALCDRNRLNQRFREGYNLIRVVDTSTGTASPARRRPAHLARRPLRLRPRLVPGRPLDGRRRRVRAVAPAGPLRRHPGR